MPGAAGRQEHGGYGSEPSTPASACSRPSHQTQAAGTQSHVRHLRGVRRPVAGAGQRDLAGVGYAGRFNVPGVIVISRQETSYLCTLVGS